MRDSRLAHVLLVPDRICSLLCFCSLLLLCWYVYALVAAVEWVWVWWSGWWLWCVVLVWRMVWMWSWRRMVVVVDAVVVVVVVVVVCVVVRAASSRRTALITDDYSWRDGNTSACRTRDDTGVTGDSQPIAVLLRFVNDRRMVVTRSDEQSRARTACSRGAARRCKGEARRHREKADPDPLKLDRTTNLKLPSLRAYRTACLLLPTSIHCNRFVCNYRRHWFSYSNHSFDAAVHILVSSNRLPLSQ